MWLTNVDRYGVDTTGGTWPWILCVQHPGPSQQQADTGDDFWGHRYLLVVWLTNVDRKSVDTIDMMSTPLTQEKGRLGGTCGSDLLHPTPGLTLTQASSQRRPLGSLVPADSVLSTHVDRIQIWCRHHHHSGTIYASDYLYGWKVQG